MQSPQQEPMAVIGAGSWGTALAIQLARAGHPTRLWGRNSAQLKAMQQARCNVRYLPQAEFPAALEAVAELQTALDGARDALVAVPSHAFRATLERSKPYLSPQTRIAWATKGFEIETGYAAASGGARGVRRAPRRRALGTNVREGGGRRPAHRHDGRLARRSFCQGAGRRACRVRVSAPTRSRTSSASKWVAP